MNANALAAIPLEAIVNDAAFAAFLFPDARSALMKKHPQFHTRILAREVFVVMKATFAGKDLAYRIAIPPEVLFGELINIAARGNQLSVRSFIRRCGFDYDCLPDSLYLLALIATMDPASPFVEEWPNKVNVAVSESTVTALDRIILQAVASQTLKVVSLEYRVNAASAALAMKAFKAHRLTNSILPQAVNSLVELVEASASDPTLSRILKNSPGLALINPGLLSPAGRLALAAIMQV